MINCEDMGKGGFVVGYTNRLGLKPQANSESPLKRTQIFSFFSRLETTFVISLALQC
jgi:hypothetical protein